MKNIILIISLLFTSAACAQERIINPEKAGNNYIPMNGDYIINNFADKFVGEYSFSQNEISFYMNLEKKKFCDSYTHVCYDRLYGQLEYKNDDKIIIKKRKISNKNKIESSNIKDKTPQISSILIENNKVSLVIEDNPKQKSIEGILIDLGDSKYSLKLKEKSGQSTLWKRRKIEKGFTLPEEMILTKTN